MLSGGDSGLNGDLYMVSHAMSLTNVDYSFISTFIVMVLNDALPFCHPLSFLRRFQCGVGTGRMSY